MRPGDFAPARTAPGGRRYPASGLVAGYRRAAAAQWAVDHAFDAPTYGEDCTNFVSNAMSHGGRLGEQSWWWWTAAPKEFHSLSWTVAKEFTAQMVQHGYVTRREIAMNQRAIAGAALGDLVLYDQNDHNGYNHLAMVVDITSNGTVLIAQHSVARSYRIWNRSWELSTNQSGWHAQLLHVHTDG